MITSFRYRGLNVLINGKVGEIVGADGDEYVIFKVVMYDGEDFFRVKKSSLTEV